MPSHRSHRSYRDRDSRSRSRSRSSSRRRRSRSNSYSRDRSDGYSSRRRERERDRIVRDEFGREVRESDLRRQKQERSSYREDRENPNPNSNPISNSQKNAKAIEIKLPEASSPVVETTTPVVMPDNTEIEEGEDIHATMEQLMGFGSFSSTKGKHVQDNDSLVNRGASRVIKQFKPIRILNRKAKIR